MHSFQAGECGGGGQRQGQAALEERELRGGGDGRGERGHLFFPSRGVYSSLPPLSSS